MSRILFISNISNKITSFATASISVAHSMNMEFYHAANWQNGTPAQIESDEKAYNIKILNVPISRSPLSKTNVKAFNELIEIIKKKEIDYIHCNTPTGGLLGRLAGKKCKVKKVIYQAHGFHFYKGAPAKNWLLYYPVEKWLAHYTDALITINREDYDLARRKFHLRNNGKVYYVPGVGIDIEKYTNINGNRAAKREELGLRETDFVLISVGELNANKNNSVIISALQKMGRQDVHLLLCGEGNEHAALQAQADGAGLHAKVHFLGYRTDINELYHAADCFVMASFREGLPRSTSEAMACGLPCAVSRIRGNTDLIDESGGALFDPHSVDDCKKAIEVVLNADKGKMGAYNAEKVEQFDLKTVTTEMVKVYESTLK